MTRRLPLASAAILVLAACGPGPSSSPSAQPATLPPLATQAPATLPPPAPPATSAPSPTATPYDITPVLNAPLADTSYSIPLIIRHVTTNMAILEFGLETPSAGRLLIVPDQPGEAIQALPFDGTGGEFDVSGLVPGAGYRAAIELGSADAPQQPGFLGQPWGEVHFKTQPDQPDAFRVAVVGDSGFGQAVTSQLGALMATYAPDLVIHTGDLVYNLQENSSPQAGFQLKLFQPFGPVMRMAPFYPTLGNHDLEDAALDQGEPYGLIAFAPFTDPALPGAVPDDRGWYAFIQRGIQFVFLNSQVAFGYPGKTEETDWLSARLAESGVRATIVVLHVPLYNSGLHTLESVPVRKAWEDLIQGANVPLVLSGHDHNYQRFVEQGRTYVISGGGSSHLYQVTIPDRNLQAWAVKTHFVLLTFSAETIDLQAIGVDGSVFDQATLPLSVAAGWSPSDLAGVASAGAPAALVR